MVLGCVGLDRQTFEPVLDTSLVLVDVGEMFKGFVRFDGGMDGDA